jgi:hypothetical protein
MKLDLLTNATVIDDAIRFVAEYQQQKREAVEASNNTQTRDESSTTTTINQLL